MNDITHNIQIGVAWADLIITQVGYILVRYVAPSVICFAIGWMIGKWVKRKERDNK